MKKLLSIILTLALVLSMATFVGAEDTGLVDVAYNMTAFSNTFYHNGNANNAIDGDPNTFFHATVQSGAQVYWYVDLGAEYPIEKISFLPGAPTNANVAEGFASYINVYLTNTRPTACTVDGAVQVFDGDATALSFDEYKDIAVTDEGSYRYVLFSKDATEDATNGMALKEVNVYTDVDSYNATTRGEGCVNIAVNKPVYTTFQFNENGHILNRANDGLLGSSSNVFWNAGQYTPETGKVDPDVVVDLGEAYTIKYVNIGDSTVAGTASVYVTNDPNLQTMTKLGDVVQTTNYQMHLYEVTDATPYRYVVYSGPVGSYYAAVGEIEAYVERSAAKADDFDDQGIVEVNRKMPAVMSLENEAHSTNAIGGERNAALANDGLCNTGFRYTQGSVTTPTYLYFDLGTSQKIHSASFLTSWGSGWTGASGAYQAAGFNNDMYLVGTNDISKTVDQWDVLASIPSTVKTNDKKLKIMPVSGENANNYYRYVGVYFNRQWGVLSFDDFKVHVAKADLKDSMTPVSATLSGTTLTVAADTVVPTASTSYTIIAAAYTGTDAKRLAGVKIGATPSFTANYINGYKTSNNNTLTAAAFSTAIDVSELDVANADSLKVMIVDNMSCMKPIVAMVDVPLAE